MIPPLILAQLVQRAYDPALMGAGTLPDLSDLGFTPQAALWGQDLDGPRCYGFLAVPADGSGGQVIACHGTEDGPEWAEDAQIRLTGNPWGPGKVHTGFSRLCGSFGWGPTFQPVLEKIVALAALSVAGHSLGAAAVRQLSMRLGHVGQIETWGEPRSCDGTAAGYAASCASLSGRRTNARDLVTMVPVLDVLDPLDGYRHVGDAQVLGSWGADPAHAHAMSNYIAAEKMLTQPKAA